MSLWTTLVFHSLVAVSWWGRGGGQAGKIQVPVFLSVLGVGEAPKSQEMFPGNVGWTAPLKRQPVNTQSRAHAGHRVGNELSTYLPSKQQMGSPTRRTFTFRSKNNNKELHTPPEMRQGCPPGRLPRNWPRVPASRPWGQRPSCCHLLLSCPSDLSSLRGPGAGCSNSRLEWAL